MPSPADISHSHLIIWVVGFFFVGTGAFGTFFFYIVKGLKKSVSELKKEITNLDETFKNEIENIDQKVEQRVELVVYMDDKEEAKKIVEKLQTTDRCLLMQRACVGAITPIMADMRDDLRSVLKNQEELAGIKEVMQLVTRRQQEVIGRIDSHMNGHSHKG